jgi:hypothetical protein
MSLLCSLLSLVICSRSCCTSFMLANCVDDDDVEL